MARVIFERYGIPAAEISAVKGVDYIKFARFSGNGTAGGFGKKQPKSYSLSDLPGLYRVFAYAASTPASILKLARQYGGLLGRPRVLLIGDDEYWAEPVPEWQRVITELKAATLLWDQIANNKVADLKRQFGEAEPKKQAFAHLEEMFNAHLGEAISTRVLLTGKVTGRFDIPVSLESALWTEFADDVIANNRYVQCRNCKKWTPEGRKGRKKFCSERCRVASARRSKK